MKDVTEKIIKFLRLNKVPNNQTLLSARFFLANNEVLFILSKTSFESDYIKEKFQTYLKKLRSEKEFSEIKEFKFSSQLDFAETQSQGEKITGLKFPGEFILLLSLSPIFRSDIKRIRREVGVSKKGFFKKETFTNWFEKSLDQVASLTDHKESRLFKLSYCINELCLRYGIDKEANEEFIENLIFFDALELVNNIRDYKKADFMDFGEMFNSFEFSSLHTPKSHNVASFLDQKNVLEFNLKIPLDYCNYESLERLFARIRGEMLSLAKKMPRYQIKKTKTPFTLRDYIIYQIYAKEHSSKKVQQILKYNYKLDISADYIRKVYQRTKRRVSDMIEVRGI